MVLGANFLSDAATAQYSRRSLSGSHSFQSSSKKSSLPDIGGSRFVNDLELHLHQYERGTARSPNRVAAEISGRRAANFDSLLSQNARARPLYNGLLTAFDYEKTSRMVSHLNDSERQMERLRRLVGVDILL